LHDSNATPLVSPPADGQSTSGGGVGRADSTTPPPPTVGNGVGSANQAPPFHWQLTVQQLLLMAIQIKKNIAKGAQTSPNTLLRREPDASKGKGIVHRPDDVCYSNT